MTYDNMTCDICEGIVDLEGRECPCKLQERRDNEVQNEQ